MDTTGFDLFTGTPLLVLAVTLLIVGAALVAAPFLGVARRPRIVEAEIVLDPAEAQAAHLGGSADVSAFRAAHRAVAP